MRGVSAMAEFTFNLRCPLRGRLVIRSCLEVTCLPAYAVIVAESRCGFSQHHCSPSHSRTVGNKEHVCLSAATLFCGCVKGRYKLRSFPVPKRTQHNVLHIRQHLLHKDCRKIPQRRSQSTFFTDGFKDTMPSFHE